MTREEEIEGIVVALDALLTAVAAEDAKGAGDHTVAMSADRAVARIEEVTTTLQGDARLLIENPVGQALRDAVQTLGKRLNEIGGVGAMGGALDRTCSLNPEEESWREGVLDRLWDGIGGWLA